MTSANIAYFKTRQEAQAIVDKLDSKAYHLRHGEYERPQYHVRKERMGRRFYIHARYYFYAGTLYPAPSKALAWHDNELYCNDNGEVLA